MVFENLTPHAIHLNSGEVFSASGRVARVEAGFEEVYGGVYPMFVQTFGEVQDLPAPEEGVTYIVSALVLSALAGSRGDVVAPATGHKATVRNEKGHILSVPGFTR